MISLVFDRLSQCAIIREERVRDHPYILLVMDNFATPFSINDTIGGITCTNGKIFLYCRKYIIILLRWELW